MKVGIIGCGNIADIYFSNSQKYFNNFQIVACADIKNEAAKECGMGRVLAGFHYVADYHCGNLLANKMFLVMNRDNYGKNLKGE